MIPVTADSPQHVDNEIDDHKEELDSWVTKVSDWSVPNSHTGVVERFVRDCNNLKTDMEKVEIPSSADLCDFYDRKNSLEIMYESLNQDIQ